MLNELEVRLVVAEVDLYEWTRSGTSEGGAREANSTHLSMDKSADLLLRGLCNAGVAVTQVGHTDCGMRGRDNEWQELMDAIVRRSVFKKRPESRSSWRTTWESKERLTAAGEVEDGAAALGLDIGSTALGHDHLGVPADTCKTTSR